MCARARARGLQRNVPSSLTHGDDRPLCVKCPCWPLTIRSLRCAKVITPGRAICERRGNVVPARARGPIYLIMMLLAIMKDPGICRTSSRTASGADNTIARSLALSRGWWTCVARATLARGNRVCEIGVTPLRVSGRESKLHARRRYQRTSASRE